ncbi:flagellar hook-length control protein FliK [Salicibibacter kimchii]|uniref:Flagellar hook-length control protein-like C-terminal domain-containing protein n=1 Tax=Salicibibacter kimchii TaxID=2099786 RepID=A0A345BVZ8_9BACI|nr:flagellar hook-length control protein FliK [Salicibibacter kimchii]AXF55129.1 hypothetical protein DT065_03240 [Salicibibacter kimchii]
MIPAGLQAFPLKEGVSTFVPTRASMKGMGENHDQTFGQRLAHFQEKYEAFPQKEGLQSSQDTFEKDLSDGQALLDALRERIPSSSESEPFLGNMDWEMAMMMTEEALSEDEGVALSSDVEKIATSFMDAEISIEEMLETVFPNSEEVAIATEIDEAFAFTEEMREAGIPPLMAFIAFVAQKGEHAKPIREKLSHYVKQLNPAMGRDAGSPKHREVSNHTKEVGKTTEFAPRHDRSASSHAAVKMDTILPNLNHGAPPPSAFVFNETMAMQALNQGEQLHVHLGDQKTEHARAVAFMNQFQQALSKGHLRSDGEGRQQLSIKLYPESLGRLDVQITRDNGVLQARLVTTTAMARELVETQLPNLRNAFHHQQLPVERIVVEEAHSQVADDQREGKPSTDDGTSAFEEESDEERAEGYLPSFEEWLEATLNQEG